MVTELALAPLENDVAVGPGIRQHRPIDVVRERAQFDWPGRGGGSLGHLGPRVDVRFPEDEEDRFGVVPQRLVSDSGNTGGIASPIRTAPTKTSETRRAR